VKIFYDGRRLCGSRAVPGGGRAWIGDIYSQHGGPIFGARLAAAVRLCGRAASGLLPAITISQRAGYRSGAKRPYARSAKAATRN